MELSFMEYEIIPRENFVPSVVNAIPGEALSPTQKLIVRLRGVRESSHLTIPQIETMINRAISRTTLYRFFEEESELRYNFNQYTIEVLMSALLVDNTIENGDDVAKDKVATFEAALQQKDEIIASQREQIEQLRAEHERKCNEYEARLTLWQQQINKKDDRMDRKDRVLDQKDDEIRQLRNRIDQLIDQLIAANSR
jgi:chromosome segregation ATPase